MSQGPQDAPIQSNVFAGAVRLRRKSSGYDHLRGQTASRGRVPWAIPIAMPERAYRDTSAIQVIRSNVVRDLNVNFPHRSPPHPHS